MKRVLTIAKNVFGFVLLIITKAFYVFWIISVLFAGLEVITYPGFILLHTKINPWDIYLAFLVAGIISLFNRRIKTHRLNLIFNKCNILLLFSFSGCYVVFTTLDLIFYDNFTFSLIHIQPKQIVVLMVLTGLSSFFTSKRITITRIVRKYFRLLIILAPYLIVIWILGNNLISLFELEKMDVAYMIENPFASHKQKMEYKLGKQFYDYTLFLKKNISSTATILIPPYAAYPWPQTGNYAYLRYFLYPRKLVNGNEYDFGHDLKKEGIGYVLIVWGETESTSDGHTHGWPKFLVESKEIICTNDNVNSFVFSGDYTFDEYNNKCKWGFIKL